MTPEEKAKKHDLEETPRETARRLVKRDTTKLVERFASLRERLHRHGRYLSDDDSRELIAFLERQFEQTRTLLDGVTEPEEFGFSSELLDHIA